MRPPLILCLALAAVGCVMPAAEGEVAETPVDLEQRWILVNCDASAQNCESISAHPTERACRTAIAATTVLAGRVLECRERVR